MKGASVLGGLVIEEPLVWGDPAGGAGLQRMRRPTALGRRAARSRLEFPVVSPQVAVGFTRMAVTTRPIKMARLYSLTKKCLLFFTEYCFLHARPLPGTKVFTCMNPTV